MKITIYTINNCNFCKQEKEYLTSNKLAFEEKNLETNREFLAEMLKLSNNFAGVPFTLVEKDNAQVVPIKGFTKEEFDAVFGFAAPSVEPVNPVVTDQAPVSTPEPVAPVAPAIPEVPNIPEIKPMEPEVPTMPEVPVVPPAPVSTPEPVAPVASVVTPEPVAPTPVADPNEELKKVIDSLGAMTNEQKPADTKPVVPPGTPSIPDFPTNK